jgi:Mn-dependent DtxR family transcriptional regulator
VPDTFTREEAQMLRQRMNINRGSVAHMISTWKTRGYIRIHNPENIVKDLNRQEYVKTSKYLKGEKTVS